MAKKKIFSLPDGMPLAEIVMGGETEAGSLVVEYLPLSQIEPDPDNPRSMGLDLDTLDTLNPEDPLYDRKQAALEGIRELARSIEKVGVQQPIKVYQEGKRYRIAFGERRFLAAALVRLETIPAWILPERPAYLRIVQFAENELHQRLGPWERIKNIRMIMEEFERYGEEAIESAVMLAEVTGFGLSMANHYFDIVTGPEDVRQALQSGEIGNVELAAAIARESDPEKRQAALTAARAGATADRVRNALKGPLRVSGERGRPATAVNLGKTVKVSIVRRIVESVLGQDVLEVLGEVDWEDFRSTSEAWQKLLRHLEGEGD